MRLQTPAWLVAGLALLLSAAGALAQGTFQNLNFESARIIPIPSGDYGPNSIATTNALPGWAVFIGSSQLSEITYNDPDLGSTWVNLWATNGAQISGRYSVLLQGGLSAPAASISQTALVPVSAESLLFEAQPGPGSLLVSLGGQNIPFFALSTGSNYTLYGGDVTAFAGQTEQLVFSAIDIGGGNDWIVDNIQFSNSGIPEPSVFSLFALGALLLGWRVLRRRRR
jgi:hypothetical protein